MTASTLGRRLLMAAGLLAAAVAVAAGALYALSDDPELTVRSLAALAARLEPRRNDVRAIAFGHQGPVDGLAPLLTWASTTGQGR